ncbi:sodium channel protein Nach-like [Coccinella septempunctata]|uniref:sodium channel protein Nach-like n=1 Tax=Coccinella septempunctata TaxID=41139 RepID=UPI001D08E300|nr:sodium channel protein Nach-like [Coccinella septempunctata]
MSSIKISRNSKKNKRYKMSRNCWKQYRRILKTSWKVQTKVFFENSTLHGVRFIAEDGRPFFEKFMWFICVMVGLITSIIIIFSLWEKFQTNPTITGLDTDFHSWDVAFPSITICQEKPGNDTLIDEFIEKQMSDFVEKDQLRKFLEFSTTLSYDNLREIGPYTKLNLSSVEKSFKKVMYSLMNKCEDVFESCEWKSKPYNCCEGFFPVFTESGFCYSFNSRHHETEEERNEGDSKEFEMRYIKETDLKWSLAFTVKNTDIKIPIYILNSDEMAGIDMRPQHIWDFTMRSISFSVKQTYTTEDTKQLSIKQRRCIFPDERKLEIDYIYTYTACARQCRMDTSMKLCGCVPFFYSISSESPYRYCRIRELECVANNKGKILDVEHCDCQLSCSNTVYEVEKLSANNEDEINTMETGFLSWPMIRYKREVLFGWVDLLVSFGGIAGLFLGFSLLSGVEIIYYFTIRAYFMILKERTTLEKIYEQDKTKPKPSYDLSLTPYFISAPLPGNGYNELRKFFHCVSLVSFYQQKIVPLNGRWRPEDTILPPYGINYMD